MRRDDPRRYDPFYQVGRRVELGPELPPRSPEEEREHADILLDQLESMVITTADLTEEDMLILQHYHPDLFKQPSDREIE